MDAKWSRWWFGATAAAVLAGIAIQLYATASGPAGFFDSTAKRTLNVFVFFTIQSNLIVGATSALLAWRPQRSGAAFAVARMMGLIGITITGIVYHVALANLLDLDSWALAADQLLHTAVPIMAVAGWLMFGPRHLTSARVARLSLWFPIAWFAFTLIRAPLARHFYPYPFIDVNIHGYAAVFVNCAWIAILFLGAAAAATSLDKALARRAEPDRTPTER